jgi:hypothetical protein
MAACPSTTRARRAPTAGITGVGAARRAEGSAASAALMHAYSAASLMAGVHPKEARASRWEEDVDLEGNTPSIAALPADRGRRRHQDFQVPPRAEARTDRCQCAQRVEG